MVPLRRKESLGSLRDHENSLRMVARGLSSSAAVSALPTGAVAPSGIEADFKMLQRREQELTLHRQTLGEPNQSWEVLKGGDDSYRNPKPTLADKLHELLTFIIRKEKQIESLRCKMAKMGQFEPRQAYERVARDRERLEASDIYHFIDRFEEHHDGQNTVQACHYLVRYWN